VRERRSRAHAGGRRVQPDSMEGCRAFEQRRRGFCEGCRAEISIEGVVRAFRRKRRRRRRRRAPFGRVADERPEDKVRDLGGELTLVEHPGVPFDGSEARENTVGAQLSGLDLARFCPEKSPQKYESGGGMWETFPMYLVYIFISTEGYGGVKGAAKPYSRPPSESHPVSRSIMWCLT
jgi:hypothetical protein